MANREDVLKRIDDFNKRAEEVRNAQLKPADAPPIPDITPAGMKGTITEEQKKILEAPKDSLSTEQQIERKALETKTELKREEKERQSAERTREREEADRIQRMQDAGKRLADSALDAAEPPIQWFEQVPTPMGLGVILAIIFVFLMAVVPVNSAGDTRLKLIWYTITGKTHLSYQDTTGGGSQGQGGLASFGETNTQAQSNLALSQQATSNIQVPDLTGIDLTGL